MLGLSKSVVFLVRRICQGCSEECLFVIVRYVVIVNGCLVTYHFDSRKGSEAEREGVAQT